MSQGVVLAPWLGIEPAPPALEGRVLTTGPPGKPHKFFVEKNKSLILSFFFHKPEVAADTGPCGRLPRASPCPALLTPPSEVAHLHPLAGPWTLVITLGLLKQQWPQGFPSDDPLKVKVFVAQSCPTLLWPRGLELSRLFRPWNSPGNSTGVAMPFSRGSSWPRDRTQVSCTAGRFFTIWATGEALYLLQFILP